MIVVFDIDGVLADANHRQHFLERRPKDWAAFFAAVADDPVIDAGKHRLLTERDRHEVVLVSGRPEHTRADTQRWLDRNGMGETPLILRPDVDRRRAADLKADLVREIGTPTTVELVIDDDESVVQRLAGLGYRTELFR